MSNLHYSRKDPGPIAYDFFKLSEILVSQEISCDFYGWKMYRLEDIEKWLGESDHAPLKEIGCL